MNEYELAAERINDMVQLGRKYAEKIASVDFKGAFVYWNPETGEYAVNAPLRKEAAIKEQLNRVGKLPLTRFDKKASIETGWVPLCWPEWYRPLDTLKKYASITSTPAMTTLVGSLIGGTLAGGYSYYRNTHPTDGSDMIFGPMSVREKLRRAIIPTIAGASIGAVPGLLYGWHNSHRTSLWDPATQKYTDPQVGFWKAMITPTNELENISPNYKYRLDKERAQAAAYGPRTKVGMLLDNGPTQDSLINVDAFNRTVWDDARNGAVTPDNALLVTSTLNASRPGGTSLVTPGAVVGTLINAGVGYVTAGLIGKALGCMNAISPQGQETLRSIGTWGGMINGIGNAIRY